MAGAVFGEGWWLTVHDPRIVNDVLRVTRINHGLHFAWQAHLLRWRLTWLALRIGNDVSYEAQINHEIYFLRGRRSIC